MKKLSIALLVSACVGSVMAADAAVEAAKQKLKVEEIAAAEARKNVHEARKELREAKRAAHKEQIADKKAEREAKRANKQ